VAVAHDARDFPSVRLLPDHHKFGLIAVLLPIFDVAESLCRDVHCPVVFDGIYFQSTRHQRAGDVGALGKQAREALFGLNEVGQDAFVMVKLQVMGKVGHELIHVVGIEGRKYFRVQPGHRLV
jgi:hypothetical protein